jgi:hypothetical protein
MKNYINKHGFKKAGPGILIIYIVSLTCAPLYHIHPDKDHCHTDGSDYHSHLIALNLSETECDTHLQPHEISDDHFSNPINPPNGYPTVSQPDVRLILKISNHLNIQINSDLDFQSNHKVYNSSKNNHRQTVFSPQQESYISANTSPPRT